MSRFLNLADQQFGLLTVSKQFIIGPSSTTKWLCKCDCGREKWIRANSLRRGLTTSCGCIGRKAGNPKHGLSRTKVYRAWASMKRRCSSSKPEYRRWAGRGIKVYKPWLNFEKFWDDVYKEIGLPPSEKHSIDRIDNDRNYEPGNLRWATHAQQMANRRYKH